MLATKLLVLHPRRESWTRPLHDKAGAEGSALEAGSQIPVRARLRWLDGRRVPVLVIAHLHGHHAGGGLIQALLRDGTGLHLSLIHI